MSRWVVLPWLLNPSAQGLKRDPPRLLGRQDGQITSGSSQEFVAQHSLARELGWQVAGWGSGPRRAVLACGLP